MTDTTNMSMERQPVSTRANPLTAWRSNLRYCFNLSKPETIGNYWWFLGTILGLWFLKQYLPQIVYNYYILLPRGTVDIFHNITLLIAALLLVPIATATWRRLSTAHRPHLHMIWYGLLAIGILGQPTITFIHRLLRGPAITQNPLNALADLGFYLYLGVGFFLALLAGTLGLLVATRSTTTVTMANTSFKPSLPAQIGHAWRHNLGRYATFTGRTGPRDYWWFTAAWMSLVALAFPLAFIPPLCIADGVLVIGLLLPYLAATTRRLRDAQMPWFGLLFPLIGLSGIIGMATFALSVFFPQPQPGNYVPEPGLAAIAHFILAGTWMFVANLIAITGMLIMLTRPTRTNAPNSSTPMVD